MVTFRAYYDASGSESRPGALVVVGVAATERKWPRFERRWEKVLSDYGVTNLHMKEYTAGRGEFASWYDDKERRAAFSAALLKALKHGTNKVFFVGISSQSIEAADHVCHWRAGGGYVLVANVCRRMVERWIKKHPAGGTVHHVFEKGDLGEADLPKIVPLQGRYASFSIVPKLNPQGERIRGFEGADFVAWEVRRLLDDVGGGGPVKLRVAVQEIARQLPMETKTITGKRLIEICQKRPDLFPPRSPA